MNKITEEHELSIDIIDMFPLKQAPLQALLNTQKRALTSAIKYYLS